MRARDLGLPFEGRPGKYNAITDVPGVEVGYSTVIQGESHPMNRVDSDFARTGVTAVLPHGKSRSAVFAGHAVLNGNGEMTGLTWVTDSGFMHGPVMITNTNSVGIVRDSTSKWMLQNDAYPLTYNGCEVVPGYGFFYPVVAETFDGVLNNINGFKVKEEHVFEALNTAHGGAIAEGNVGGGTGMICHGFKGGTGTSSRVVELDGTTYHVGVLVQANHGSRHELCVKGIPLGREIVGCERETHELAPVQGSGSIIVIIATDAPFLPWQLNKIARRAGIGVGRLGGGNHSSSGDIFLAFSTANEHAFSPVTEKIDYMPDTMIDPFFVAAAQATEEAVMNALTAAETLKGRNCNTAYGMPHDQVRAIVKKYQHLADLYKTEE